MTHPSESSDPRISLTPRAAEIALAARTLLEEEGVHALSMRNIGARLGIRAASLYEHFTDKRAVENAIIAAGLWEQGDHILERVRAASPDEPLITVVILAFRHWGLAHPALYRLITSRDLDRQAPDIEAAEFYASEEVSKLVGLDAPEAGLAIWAFAHGALDLELNQRFPPGYEIDAIWSLATGHIAAVFAAAGAQA